MAINRMHLAAALVLTATLTMLAHAQVTMVPESPKWGETITITADPPKNVNETQRFSKNDQLFAVLQVQRQLKTCAQLLSGG